MDYCFRLCYVKVLGSLQDKNEKSKQQKNPVSISFQFICPRRCIYRFLFLLKNATSKFQIIRQSILTQLRPQLLTPTMQRNTKISLWQHSDRQGGGGTHSKCAGCDAYASTCAGDSRTATSPISNPLALGTEIGNGEFDLMERRPGTLPTMAWLVWVQAESWAGVMPCLRRKRTVFLLVVVEGESEVEVKVKRTDVVDSHFGLLLWWWWCCMDKVLRKDIKELLGISCGGVE